MNHPRQDLCAHCPRCNINFTYGHTGLPMSTIATLDRSCPRCKIQRVQGIYEYPVQPKEKP